jgi:hypothetical protein
VEAMAFSDTFSTVDSTIVAWLKEAGSKLSAWINENPDPYARIQREIDRLTAQSDAMKKARGEFSEPFEARLAFEREVVVTRIIGDTAFLSDGSMADTSSLFFDGIPLGHLD